MQLWWLITIFTWKAETMHDFYIHNLYVVSQRLFEKKSLQKYMQVTLSAHEPIKVHKP